MGKDAFESTFDLRAHFTTERYQPSAALLLLTLFLIFASSLVITGLIVPHVVAQRVAVKSSKALFVVSGDNLPKSVVSNTGKWMYSRSFFERLEYLHDLQLSKHFIGAFFLTRRDSLCQELTFGLSCFFHFFAIFALVVSRT